MMRFIRSHYFTVFLMRIILLYAIYAICRIGFYLYNYDIIGGVQWGDLWSVLKGSFIFDSASIFYVNIPFIFLSLLPFRFRERKGYQTFLLWIFVVTNALGLLVNIGDIFYFPFKLSRVASDDLHFLAQGNFWSLMLSFIVDFWTGILMWIACIMALWMGFRLFSYRPDNNRPLLRPVIFEISQLIVMGLVAGFMIFAIRGYSLSAASYPINMSDASLYVKPKYASLVLSNPFCLIRTSGQKVSYPQYFDEEELDRFYPVMHQPLDSVKVRFEGQPNIVLIVLEGFGSAHLKSFSDRFGPDDRSYTPFLDSLATESYVFTNAYQNGLRSIDAMPAIWASIPTFKTQFLSMPNSVAEYKAMPSCLADMGYSTMFLHGAVRESMGFVSFGQMAGIQMFYSREDYETENGRGDFDGKWGIWDHKFLPYAKEKLDLAAEPFFATIFTLSSHHPFSLPPGFEEEFREGTMPIHRVIEYSDWALRNFFEAASQEDWFKNTLFVLTADHASGADNDKYRTMPFAYSIPLLMYYKGNGLLAGDFLPDGRMMGSHTGETQHIDLMPTLLRMTGYDKPFFAFGRDFFNDADSGFAISYYGSAFNMVTDSMRYVFNEKEVLAAYNYIEDYTERETIRDSKTDSLRVTRMKALVQQYYRHLRERNYLSE